MSIKNDEMKEYRWDVFIAHDAKTFRPLMLSYELFNLISPDDFPDKLQYGVKVIVDNTFKIHDPDYLQLSKTSVFEPSSENNELDDLSIWSGSGIHSEGVDFLYYTAISNEELQQSDDPKDVKSLGIIPQRMFCAFSKDNGLTWQRSNRNPLVNLDDASNMWYERCALDNVVEGKVSVNSACRDPFVYQASENHNFFADDMDAIDEGKYYMLFTARVDQLNAPAHQLDVHFRGCIGVASASSPYGPFNIEKPILNTGTFGDMELPHLVSKDGTDFLFFSVQHQCIDGHPSTDPDFAKQLGISPTERNSYGYYFNTDTCTWQPANDRNGIIETPPGIYGIRIFQHPDNENEYSARGFYLPPENTSESTAPSMCLTPLLKVDWSEDNRIKISEP